MSTGGAMRSLAIDIEVSRDPEAADVETRLAQRLREALGLTVALRRVPTGALPRFEMKARRLVIE